MTSLLSTLASPDSTLTTAAQLGKATVWGIIILAGLIVGHRWLSTPGVDHPWGDTEAEETLEAAQFAAYRNQWRDSHLSEVCNYDHELGAFSLDSDDGKVA